MASFHLRSISFPSKSHPLTVSLTEQLDKLKKSESTSIGHKLGGLKELYECVDDYLQTFSHQKHNQSAEKALNGSVRLLDMCSTTRDFLSQMKECVQGLESSLRRRRSDAQSSLNEVDAYMVARKKLNQAIVKYLRKLNRQDKNCRTTSSNDNTDLNNMISMLKDAEQISFSVFESILSFIFQPNTKSNFSGFSIISKLLQSKNLSCEEEIEANEVSKIEAELIVFKSNKDINQMPKILNVLEALEQSLIEIEEEVDCVYRRLVKTRVSLLNILTP
ncbi:uncharacterized protein [Euphorbia lathyris]|uniref:uncharacterized protein isoform X1 n=1 Tax=Euphorbia lathyris TaxID=212925 RepID=UPI0033131392